MNLKLMIRIELLLLVIAGCSPGDPNDFAEQVAREISATQTAQAGNVSASSGSLYVPIQAGNASQLETLRTFTSEPITGLNSASDADVLAYVSTTGIHILDPDTLGELGFIPQPAGIFNLATSPDGRFVAAGDNKGKIHIWSTSDLSIQGTIEDVWVDKLAYSMDGRILVGISGDGVYGWQVPDGTLRFSTVMLEDAQGYTIGGAETFAIIPETNLIVFPHVIYIGGTAGRTTGLNLTWYKVNPSSGKCEAMGGSYVPGKSDDTRISDMALSYDGSTLVTAWANHPVEIWRTDGGIFNFDYTFPDQTTDAKQVIFSTDGNYLGIITRGGSIQLWDVQKRELLSEWSGNHLTFLNGNSRAVLVSASEIILMDISTGEKIESFPYTAVKTVAISPNGEVVALGMNNGRIEIWSQRGKTLVRTLEYGEPYFFYLSFIRQGQYLAAFSRDSGSLFWQTSNWEILNLPAGISDPLFLPESSLFIATAPDPSQLYIWDLSVGASRFTLKHPANVQDFRVGMESLIAVSVADGTIWFWDYSDGTFLRSLDDYLEFGPIGNFSTNGELFAGMGDERTIKIWSIRDAKLLQSREFEFSIGYGLFATADSMILGEWDGEETYLWRFKEDDLQRFPGTFENFLPSGEQFITRYSREIRIWQLMDGSETQKISLPGRFLRFSNDSTLVFIQRYPESNDDQEYLQILSVESGDTLVSQEVDGSFGWLSLSEDGSTLAGISSTGVLYIWGIPR